MFVFTRLLLLSLVLSGCLVRAPRWDDAAAPPPPKTFHEAEPVVQVVAPMTREEAALAGLGYARSTGYSARIERVTWVHNRVWRVDVEVARGDVRGRLRAEYDAYTRGLVHARLHLHDERHQHDDDEDDD